MRTSCYRLLAKLPSVGQASTVTTERLLWLRLRRTLLSFSTSPSTHRNGEPTDRDVLAAFLGTSSGAAPPSSLDKEGGGAPQWTSSLMHRYADLCREEEERTQLFAASSSVPPPRCFEWRSTAEPRLEQQESGAVDREMRPSFLLRQRATGSDRPDGAAKHRLEAELGNFFIRRIQAPARFLWAGGLRDGSSQGGSEGGRAAAHAMLWPTAQCPSVKTGNALSLQSSAAASRAVFHFQPTTASTSLSLTPHQEHLRGGSLFHANDLESYECVFTTAATQSLHRCATGTDRRSRVITAEERERHRLRFVAYVSGNLVTREVLTALRRAGYQHIRQVPSIPHPLTHSYSFHFPLFAEMVGEDLAHGRVPSVVVLHHLAGPTASSDPLESVTDFCRRTGMWAHVTLSEASAALQCATRSSRSGDADGNAGWQPPLPIRSLIQTEMLSLRAAMEAVDSLQTPLPPAGEGRSLFPALRLTAFAAIDKCVASHPPQDSTTSITDMEGDWVPFDRLRTTRIPAAVLQTVGTAVALADISSCGPPGWVAAFEFQTGLARQLQSEGQLEVQHQALAAGSVMMRLRVMSDEATQLLCTAIQTALGDLTAVRDGPHGAAAAEGEDVRLFCSVVHLRGRAWVCLRCQVTRSEEGGTRGSQRIGENSGARRHTLLKPVAEAVLKAVRSIAS